jgi:hypothetical protein
MSTMSVRVCAKPECRHDDPQRLLMARRSVSRVKSSNRNSKLQPSTAAKAGGTVVQRIAESEVSSGIAHQLMEQLYDLVWSQPMAKVAAQFGLSDRGLAKLCQRQGTGRNKQRAGPSNVHRCFRWSRRDRSHPSLFQGRPRSPAANRARPPSLRSPCRTKSRKRSIGKAHRSIASRSPRRCEIRTASPRNGLSNSVAIEKQPGQIRCSEGSTHRTSPAEEAIQKRRIRIIDALLKALEARGFKVRTEHEYAHGPSRS